MLTVSGIGMIPDIGAVASVPIQTEEERGGYVVNAALLNDMCQEHPDSIPKMF